MTENTWLQEPYLALGARVRLGRNVEGLPFGGRLEEGEGARLLDRAGEAVHRAPGERMTLVPLHRLTPDRRRALAAGGAISQDMTAKDPCGLICGRDKGLSLLVNGQDHLTMQARGPASSLEDFLQKALNLERLLEESFAFSYDEQWGYLTQDPQRIGTGLEASVVLHLPLLTRTGQMDSVLSAARRAGMEVHNTEHRGETYRIVNQVTLGWEEEEICRRVEQAAQGILSREAAWRQAFRRQHPGVMEDRVWRAMGIARCARRMDWKEGVLAVSQLRLGAALDILPGFSPEELDQLQEDIHPALLCLRAGRPLSQREEEEARAERFRRTLAQKPLED